MIRVKQLGVYSTNKCEIASVTFWKFSTNFEEIWMIFVVLNVSKPKVGEKGHAAGWGFQIASHGPR